jgi:hypothetical protein
MNTIFKKILIAYVMLVSMPLAAEFKLYAEKHELSSYDIAVLYSVFYKLRQDPNDKTVKIATLNQELIDNGIPHLP